MTTFNLPKRLREEAELIRDREPQETETARLLEEAADELEEMRPTFEQLNEISQVHTSACSCRACEVWSDYEARKPK